jgi:hypothetical protein
MKSSSRILLIIAISFFVGCSSLSVKRDTALETASLKSDVATLERIAKSDKPLTDDQKIMIKDVVEDLKAANVTMEQQAKDNAKMQAEAMKNAKDAGAGGITKYFLGIVALGIGAFIIHKFI